jgi:hypothetical protein
MQFGLKSALPCPVGQRQAFVESRDGAIEIARARLRSAQRELEEGTND